MGKTFDSRANILNEIDSKTSDFDKIDVIKNNFDLIFSGQDLQKTLIKDKSRKIRELIIGNTSEEEILLLAVGDFCSFNRILVAERSKDEKTLSILSADPVVWVRCAVAENPRISNKTFKILLNDPSIIVTTSIIKNGSLWNHKDSIFDHLSKRSDYYIRSEILDKKTIPYEIFNVLIINHNCPFLIQKAISHRNCPEEIYREYDFILNDKAKILNEFEKIVIKMIATEKNFKNILGQI